MLLPVLTDSKIPAESILVTVSQIYFNSNGCWIYSDRNQKFKLISSIPEMDNLNISAAHTAGWATLTMELVAVHP